MLDAGLAQVDVNVDEPRSDDTAGGVMDFRVWGFDLFFDGRDQSVFHQNIARAVEPGRRVDHPAVLHQKSIHGFLRLPTRTEAKQRGYKNLV